MTARILLARHGDTFEAGQKPVFVGARNDLPLTARGREQARQVGLLIARSNLVPSIILAGPLQRTREFAKLTALEIPGAPEVTIDARLHELDYGKWAGLSNEEVAAKFGEAELKEWNERGEWPKSAGWPEDEVSFSNEPLALVREIQAREGPLALIVTSNGRLRYFARAVPGAYESMRAQSRLKVKTGNISLLEFGASGPALPIWNADPAGLTTLP